MSMPKGYKVEHGYATVDCGLGYREIAENRIQSLEGKVYEIKRKADILLEKGKRL